MKHICLYDLKQTGVIILEETGVEYFNFTNGSTNTTSRAEGIFVPISNCPLEDIPEESLHYKLQQALHDSVDNTTGATPLNASNISAINQLLLEISSSDSYRVDLDKSSESQLGWLYVRVTPAGDFSHFAGFDEFTGILTWPNLITP